jgi:aerobic carbon-monoxide dehydrogenase small subunit
MRIEFTLDYRRVGVNADPAMRLSDLLHDELGKLSVRSGCRQGRCGSCIVLKDGRTVPACLVPAYKAQGAEIVTFEGFSATAGYADISEAFRRAGVEDCEYCHSGKVLSVEEILNWLKDPDEDEIIAAMAGVSCPCTEIGSLVRAVSLAIELRRERLYGGER